MSNKAMSRREFVVAVSAAGATIAIASPRFLLAQNPVAQSPKSALFIPGSSVFMKMQGNVMHSSSSLDNTILEHEIAKDTFVWKERMHWGPEAGLILAPSDVLWTAHQRNPDGSLRLAKVWANVANEYGYVSTFDSGGCTLHRFDHHHEPTGELLHVTYSDVLSEDPLNVILNGSPSEVSKIRNDMFMQIIGLQTGDLSVRATRILCWNR